MYKIQFKMHLNQGILIQCAYEFNLSIQLNIIEWLNANGNGNWNCDFKTNTNQSKIPKWNTNWYGN